VQDYERHGVVDMADKQAVFKLIQDLNAEDLSMLTLSPEPSSPPSSQSMSSPDPFRRRALLQAVLPLSAVCRAGNGMRLSAVGGVRAPGWPRNTRARRRRRSRRRLRAHAAARRRSLARFGADAADEGEQEAEETSQGEGALVDLEGDDEDDDFLGDDLDPVAFSEAFLKSTTAATPERQPPGGARGRSAGAGAASAAAAAAAARRPGAPRGVAAAVAAGAASAGSAGSGAGVFAADEQQQQHAGGGGAASAAAPAPQAPQALSADDAAALAAVADPPRIRVIVRKRPLNRREQERGENDVLECASGERAPRCATGGTEGQRAARGRLACRAGVGAGAGVCARRLGRLAPV
jgi:hypothetical protein